MYGDGKSHLHFCKWLKDQTLAQHIIDHAGFGYKVCTSDIKVFDLICPHYFSGCAVTDTAQHGLKFGQSNNIRIGSKKFFIVCARSHSDTSFSESMLSMAEKYAIMCLRLMNLLRVLLCSVCGSHPSDVPPKSKISVQIEKSENGRRSGAFLHIRFKNSSICKAFGVR